MEVASGEEVGGEKMEVPHSLRSNEMAESLFPLDARFEIEKPTQTSRIQCWHSSADKLDRQHRLFQHGRRLGWRSWWEEDGGAAFVEIERIGRILSLIEERLPDSNGETT